MINYYSLNDLQVTPYNIRVTVAFPPDTDTPGYKVEMEGKVTYR